MTSNKILFFSVILVMCSVGLSGQNFSTKNLQAFDTSDNLLTNALAGGLNSPQFNEIDLDQDGTLDLMIFDRDGDAIVPYLYKNGQYQYAPQYKTIFPRFKNWVRIRDYNMDGIPDIFCYNLESPLDGVEIYNGVLVDGQLRFEKYTQTFGDFEIIYYKFQNFYYNMEVISTDIPEIIDVDGDGDLDIISFVGDESSVRWYQNICVEEGISLDEPTYILKDVCWGRFKESSFNESIFLSDDPSKCAEGFVEEGGGNTKSNIHSGSTLTLYDDDGDGVYEALIGDLTNQHIIWLDNGGSAESAYMTSKDTAFPSYDQELFLYIFNAAFEIDVDRDGNSDLLICPNNEGGASNMNNVHYYRNAATNGQHDFEFVQDDAFNSDMFEFGSLTNPAICDFNQDGKKDILVGTFGKFRAGMNPDARLVLLENISDEDGLKFKITDENYLDFENFNNSYFSFAPTFGDLDGDGDDDLIVGTQNGDLLYLQNTAGVGNTYAFAPPIFEYADIDVGDNAKPQLVDLNRDGLLDIIIGERNQNENPFNEAKLGNINYFENQGSVTSPVFDADVNALPNTPTLGGVVTRVIQESFSGSAAPTFIDTGSDYILYTGSESGRMKVYQNVVDSIYGAFTLVSDRVVALDEGKRNTIAIGDLDNDGFLDLVIGNQRGGLAIYDSNMDLQGTVDINKKDDFAFTVYPNPARESFKIQSDVFLESFTVYDMMGTVLLKESGAFVQKEVYTAEWPIGLYFLELSSRDGSKRVVKVIVE